MAIFSKAQNTHTISNILLLHKYSFSHYMLLIAIIVLSMHHHRSGRVLWCVRRQRWGLPMYTPRQAGSNPWPDAENWSDNITRVRRTRQGREETGQARAAACSARMRVRANLSLIWWWTDRRPSRNLSCFVYSAVRLSYDYKLCSLTIFQIKVLKGLHNVCAKM